MIGQTIEIRPRFPWLSLLSVVAAFLPLAAAVRTENPHWAVLAVLPCALAITLNWFRQRGLVARFTETAMEVVRPPSLYPIQR
jgi:hypothetical protein